MEELISRLMPDILALFLLLLLLLIIHKNYYFSGKKEETYYKTILVTLVTVVMEIMTVFLEDSPYKDLRLLYILCNALGFTLSPFVCFGLALMHNENYVRRKHIFAIPLYVYAVSAVLSGWTGWIFYVGPDNSYQRGPLFFLSIIVALYSFILLLFGIYRQYKKYERTEKIYLIVLYVIVLSGSIIQFIFPNVLAIWGSVAVSLVLYYVFMREMQTKYDALTGSHNRYSFYAELDDLRRRERAVIVFLDLNNLKHVNDTRGHKYGDLYLKNAAALFEESFAQVGKVYRIGGDEFCILCRDCSIDSLKTYYSNLHKNLEKAKEGDKDFSVAYGSAEWIKESGETLSAVVERADQIMYEQKRTYKKTLCG